MRRGRLDANHTEVAQYLLARACSVQSLAQLGAGAPDLLVAKNERTCVVEVKDGEKPESGRRLRPAQERWRSSWLGKHFVVETLEDCGKVMEWLDEALR